MFAHKIGEFNYTNIERIFYQILGETHFGIGC